MSPVGYVVAAATPADSLQLIEIGGVLLALGITAFVTAKFKISSVPFFLLAGLMCGEGGFLPLELSEKFLGLGAQIGALLLLLLLGLEYSVREIGSAFRSSRLTGVVDLLNAIPGASRVSSSDGVGSVRWHLPASRTSHLRVSQHSSFVNRVGNAPALQSAR